MADGIMLLSYTTYVPWMRFLVVLFILIPSSSWGSAIPQVNLSNTIESQSLLTSYWADTSKLATPSEAKAALMSRESGELIDENFTVPIQGAYHWFAVTLKNTTDQTIRPSIYIKQPYHSSLICTTNSNHRVTG